MRFSISDFFGQSVMSHNRLRAGGICNDENWLQRIGGNNFSVGLGDVATWCDLPIIIVGLSQPLERLYENGLISNPIGKAKSISFTEEGYQKATKAFEELFSKEPD